MHLLRMGFFQEVEKDEFGEIMCCKMHDIMHDLALYLIGEEGEFGKSSNVSSSTRHVSLAVEGDEDGSWGILPSLLNVKSIRSCMLSKISYKHSQPNLDHIWSHFKMLRTLTLFNLGIEYIPPSIGELKLVRYLDLSLNNFGELPNSITNLVNLLVLKLEGCKNLKVWPRNFKNLIKLKVLKFSNTFLSMPDGIVGMVNLQYLSSFKVQNWSELDGLNKMLERVRGYLPIEFDSEMKVDDEGRWQLPATISLRDLKLSYYPGHGIRCLGNNVSGIKLKSLQLYRCNNVKYLPFMSNLPFLKCLHLFDLPELEFVEEEEEEEEEVFLPCLKELTLIYLPKLKGWRRKVATEAASISSISGFPGETLASLEELKIKGCSSLTSLHLASTYLLKIDIDECSELLSIEMDQTLSLRCIRIKNCKQLLILHIAAHILAGLEKMMIEDCPELRLSELSCIRSCVTRAMLSLSLPSLKKMTIKNCEGNTSLRFVELKSLEICFISGVNGLQSLHIPSPHLQQIRLSYCVGLTSVEVEAATDIDITHCFELKNFWIAQPAVVQTLSITSPPDWGFISNLHECNYLREIVLDGVDGGYVERLLSSSSSSPSLQERDMSIFKSTGSLTVALISLEKFAVWDVHGLKTLIIKSSHLKTISIIMCKELTSIELESPIAHSEGHVDIRSCIQLKNVRIPRPIALKKLLFIVCWGLSLNTGVDWDSLPELKNLQLHPLPLSEKLPQCLLQRQAFGQLRIADDE